MILAGKDLALDGWARTKTANIWLNDQTRES
jgi:hypothetical protein